MSIEFIFQKKVFESTENQEWKQLFIKFYLRKKISWVFGQYFNLDLNAL